MRGRKVEKSSLRIHRIARNFESSEEVGFDVTGWRTILSRDCSVDHPPAASLESSCSIVNRHTYDETLAISVDKVNELCVTKDYRDKIRSEKKITFFVLIGLVESLSCCVFFGFRVCRRLLKDKNPFERSVLARREEKKSFILRPVTAETRNVIIRCINSSLRRSARERILRNSSTDCVCGLQLCVV